MINKCSFKNYLSFVLRYTLIFAFFWFLSHLFLYLNGQAMLYWDDCISEYFEVEPFKSRVLHTILNGSSAWTNFNLAADITQIAVNGFDLFDFVWFFFPGRKVETVYVMLNVFRIWTAGLFAILLLFYKGVDSKYLIPASMIYVLWGFVLTSGIIQPIFTPMFVFLPLIMLGMDRFFKEGKGAFFSVIIGICFFFSASMMYFLLPGIILYFFLLIHEFHVIGKKIITKTLSLMGYGILGLALGMPLGMSYIIELLNTTRFGNETVAHGNFKDFIELLREQFGHVFLVSKENKIGSSIIILFPVFYVLISKKMNKHYLFFIIIGFLILNIPWFREWFGPTIATTRWCSILGLLAAILFAQTMPEMLNDNRICLRWILNISVLLFTGFTFFLIREEEHEVIWLTAIVFASGIVLSNLMLHYQKKIVEAVCIYLMLSISATISGYYVYKYAYKLEVSGIKRGHVATILETYAPRAGELLPEQDTSFYRVDQTTYDNEMLCNLSYWYGYNGTDAFTGWLHSELINYCYQMENTGLIQSNKKMPLGGKLTEEMLAGVKYYILDTTVARNVPYGFEMIRDDGKYQLYRNPNPLSLPAFYKRIISEDSFEKLNIAEKQEIMLKTLVNDKEEYSEVPRTASEELSYEIMDLREVELIRTINVTDIENNTGDYTNTQNMTSSQKDHFRVMKGGASITLRITEWNGPGELYVEIRGVSHEGAGNYLLIVTNGISEGEMDNNQKTKETNNFAMDRGRIGGKTNITKNGQEDLCFWLGAYDELNDTQKEIQITIPSAKDMQIGEIHVYRRDLSEANNVIKELNSLEILKQKIQWDHISTDIIAKETGYLFFSIPYRENWECYIDGQKVNTFKANYMYIGAEIKAGKHNVVLKYVPREFFIGMLLSVFAATSLSGITLLKRRRKLSNINVRE